MTLEDFFTLTEMKDGLMALSRVEELVSVMQKDKDNSLKNVGEAARQWATVASTLAATENQDTLDHFIQLDGLYFLDWWLQEAHKCSDETNESSVEESISALLVALGKLPIDKERSLSSGIGTTVKSLFGHKSYMVQERAKALFDSWNPEKHNGIDDQETEKDVGSDGNVVKPTAATVALDNGTLEAASSSGTDVGGNSCKEFQVEKPSGSEYQHSRGSDSLQPETSRGVTICVSKLKDDCHQASGCVAKEEGFEEDAQRVSIVSVPFQESPPRMKETTTCPAERTSTRADGSHLAEASIEVRSSGVTNLKDFTSEVRATDNANSTSPVLEQVSFADTPMVEQPSAIGKVDGEESFSPKKTSSGLDDANRLTSKLKSAVGDCGMPKHSQNRIEGNFTDQAGGCYSSGCISRKPEYLDEENIGAVESAEELTSERLSKVGGVKDYATIAFSRPEMNSTLSQLDKRKSSMEFDYEVDDALEVARQVAKEVEQEVVDYREQFCSSSDKNSEAGVLQPSSPDSINDEQDHPLSRPPRESPKRENLHHETISPNGENHLIGIQNTDKAEDSMPDTDSSLITEALHMPDDVTKKAMCDFDLNKEVCSEEMDQPKTASTVPITFVSASKAHAPSFPVAPLHFGGVLGWKGSAATSAFRPASPRKTIDGEKTGSVDGSSQISKQRLLEKTPSVEGTSQCSKRRQGFLDIDLNVAEGDDDVAPDPRQVRQVPVSSELASRESSLEVSSRRAERLKLDLNRVDEPEDVPLPHWRTEGHFVHHHQNGSASPASSSSARQPSVRNINLNDNPSCFDDSNEQRAGLASYSSMETNVSGGMKQVDPVISIMGTKVEISRKDSAPQTQSFLPNGRIAELPISATILRPGRSVVMQPSVALAPGHALSGYNLATGPCMSLSPALYGLGSSPYVVDSRGTPVLPQLMSAPADVPPYSRQPFLMSLSNSQSGLNRVGIAEPSLDLNSGLAVMEAESRETGGFRQLCGPGHGISIEGSVGSASQPLNLGMGMKRKEPDGGLELYHVGYKHQTPWR